MKIPKMPKFFHWIYPKRIWAFPYTKKEVYLTFDDGPTEEITHWILDQLDLYQAKATFFCIGKNLLKHPELYAKMIAKGHSVGNHTFSHKNGWKTKTDAYVQDVDEAQKVINQLAADYEIPTKKSKLFRPPYGRMTSAQAQLLLERDYKLIMWSIISFDYDEGLAKEKCLDFVLKNIEPGSIIIFHDSLKAEKNMKYALPKVLEFLQKEGYSCQALIETKAVLASD